MEHPLNRRVFLLQIHLSTPCHLHRYGNTLTVQCTAALIYCCLSALRTCVTYVAASMQEAELNYTSGYATWFTAGGAIRIAHYDVIDDVITRKL